MRSRIAVVMLLAGGALIAGRLYASNGYPGRTAYLRYCSSCHGDDGKGGGVVAQSLRIKPPDLTQLAKRHGGTFPYDEVRATIDGRQRLAAHGNRKMPVWGTVFGKEQTYETPESHVRSQVNLLVDYLSTIQTK
jgi:mono/diheme cytochrome c family protein